MFTKKIEDLTETVKKNFCKKIKIKLFAHKAGGDGANSKWYTLDQRELEVMSPLSLSMDLKLEIAAARRA